MSIKAENIVCAVSERSQGGPSGVGCVMRWTAVVCTVKSGQSVNQGCGEAVLCDTTQAQRHESLN